MSLSLFLLFLGKIILIFESFALNRSVGGCLWHFIRFVCVFMHIFGVSVCEFVGETCVIYAMRVYRTSSFCHFWSLFSIYNRHLPPIPILNKRNLKFPFRANTTITSMATKNNVKCVNNAMSTELSYLLSTHTHIHNGTVVLVAVNSFQMKFCGKQQNVNVCVCTKVFSIR